MTTALRDFRRSSYEATNITIQTNAAHPYVFVVKKNKSILSALIAWLKEQATSSGGRLDVPVLMLDDESDYASINTRDDTNPTAINQALRDVLGMFTRSSYVAFTATPFANIFIDHGVENDLFPRNFVYALEAPTNYVGSVATFGTSEEVRTDGIARARGRRGPHSAPPPVHHDGQRPARQPDRRHPHVPAEQRDPRPARRRRPAPRHAGQRVALQERAAPGVRPSRRAGGADAHRHRVAPRRPQHDPLGDARPAEALREGVRRQRLYVGRGDRGARRQHLATSASCCSTPTETASSPTRTSRGTVRRA